jgi:hypothetical protein
MIKNFIEKAELKAKEIINMSPLLRFEDEGIKCPICGSNTISIKDIETPDFDLIKCTNCKTYITTYERIQKKK